MKLKTAFGLYLLRPISLAWYGFFGLKFRYQLPTLWLLAATITLAALQWYWVSILTFLITLVVWSQAAIVKD